MRCMDGSSDRSRLPSKGLQLLLIILNLFSNKFNRFGNEGHLGFWAQWCVGQVHLEGEVLSPGPGALLIFD